MNPVSFTCGEGFKAFACAHMILSHIVSHSQMLSYFFSSISEKEIYGKSVSELISWSTDRKSIYQHILTIYELFKAFMKQRFPISDWDLLLLSVLYHNKPNTFGFWTLGQIKQAILKCCLVLTLN